jgi:hypothetical protein
MSSSPCSSSIDEPITNSSSFIPSYQSQQIYSNKYNNPDDDDENDESACSSKENFLPYYSEPISTNIEGENEFNGIYSNTTMQSNEHFSYSSKILEIFLLIQSTFNLDMYNPYYQPFAHHTVADYDTATRYNANYGLMSYDSSYITYPSTTNNFNYMNDNYPSTQ